MDVTETCATDKLHARLARTDRQPASQPESPPRQNALCDGMGAASAYGVSAAQRDIRHGRRRTARMEKTAEACLKKGDVVAVGTMWDARQIFLMPYRWPACPLPTPGVVCRGRSPVRIPRHDRPALQHSHNTLHAGQKCWPRASLCLTPSTFACSLNVHHGMFTDLQKR